MNPKYIILNIEILVPYVIKLVKSEDDEIRTGCLIFKPIYALFTNTEAIFGVILNSFM